MKISTIILSSLMIFLAACGDNGKPVVPQVKAPAPAVNADSIGIAESLHAFFKWYGANIEQLAQKINFVNEKGPHPKLDEAKLAAFLSEFVKSGVVSSTLVDNETKFYRKCAESWKAESSGEVITGMDYDRFYCGQDWDAPEFLSAGVSSKITGDVAAVKLLLAPNGPNGGPRDFELKKENGKWMLSKTNCE